MKLTAKLAYSQLFVNRKRTAWTLLGIALSTALITVVTNLAVIVIDIFSYIGGDEPVPLEVLSVVVLFPAAILSIIIIAMSVIVISNGFRVSASERTAQFGILKSVGATRRQIKATVMYESLFLSAIGIPIGVIAGLILAFVGVQVANHFLYDINSLTQIMIQEVSLLANFIIAWQAIVAAVVMSIITVLISANKPAGKYAKITAIDSIRGVGEVQIKSKQVRTSFLTQKLFGFEGVLAAKSMKRSRRNFRASVAALTIAIILFVVASGISATMGQIENLMFGVTDATVMAEYISSWGRRNEATGEWDWNYVPNPIHSSKADIITERLLAVTPVVAVGSNTATYRAILPMAEISPAMTERGIVAQNQQYAEVSLSLITIDPKTYTYLANLAGVPHGSNILLNQFSVNERGNVVIFEPLYSGIQNMQLIDTDGITREVEIHGVLTADQLPPELYPFNPSASTVVSLLVPEGYMRMVTWFASPEDVLGFILYATDVLEGFFPRGEDGTYAGRGYSIMVFETSDFMRLMNIGISMASVFVYGFTVLLTLIGLTSVISTISANVQMRAREFAILQSVGMTYGGLKHMLNLESIICSAKSVALGLPVSIVLTYVIHLAISTTFPVVYQLPWVAILQCIAGIFAITWLTMRFAVSRLRKENIVESIRA